MKNMLDRIIEIDREAQKIMDMAQQDKIKSANEIGQKKDQIKQKLLANAREKMKKNRELKTKEAEKAIKAINDDKKKKLEAMQQLYEKNVAVWVDTIVKRTLEG